MENNLIPLLMTHNIVIFPQTIMTFDSDEPIAKSLIKDATALQKTDTLIGLVGKKNSRHCEFGVLAKISDFQEEADSFLCILKAEKSRFKILNLRNHEHGYKLAEISVLNDEFPKTDQEKLRTQALLDKIRELWTELLDYILADEIDKEFCNNFNDLLEDIKNSADFAKMDKTLFFLCSNLKVGMEELEEILEEINFEKRTEKIVKALIKTVAFEKIRQNISEQYKTKQEKTQEDNILRFFLEKTKELLKDPKRGEPDNHSEFLEKSDNNLSRQYLLLKDKIPKDAQQVIEDELRQLENDIHSSEMANLKTHLNYCINKLPWGKETRDNQDLNAVKAILDEDHYGLEKIKTRILEHLAVKKLNPQSKSPIICFAGPPGVGKTSLGKSIAKALGRNFTKISIGGVRDEAEIRGHRRTYVSSLPGRIIEGIIKANSLNPVFMIDEIDKMGKEYGDANLASALLEVLDPEQNHSFQDHYLNFGFDLRKTFFIATANMIDKTMPSALKDRLEIINLSGYAEFEKIKIAKQFLIPKQIQETGINNIVFTQPAIEEIIQEYTDEAGVRNLERQIEKICRTIALKIALNKDYPKRIEPQIITQQEFLGSPKFIVEKTRKISPGVSIGLGINEDGGAILYIEAFLTKGSGQFSKTGGLGEDMQDSIKVAQTLIRDGHQEINFDERLVHVHVPRGFSKDGPSAGLAIYMALESFCRKQAIRENLAMTGEINLEKLVLEVGGIREKVLVAKRAGVKEIILPKENKNDLEDIPTEIKNGLVIHLVETIAEAVKISFPLI